MDGMRRGSRGRSRGGSYGSRGEMGGRSRGGRGGRGGGSQGDTRREVRFGFKALQSMVEKDPNALVIDMTSDRCLPATEALLSQLQMTDDMVVLVFRVFAQACECDTTTSSLQKLLSKLPKSIYLNYHLSSYINRMASSSRIDSLERESQLNIMVKLFADILRRLPSSFADLPLPQLYCCTTMLSSSGSLCDVTIQAAVEELNALKNEMAEKVKKQAEERTYIPKRRNTGEEAAIHDNDAPPEDFRQLDVVPTQQDVHSNTDDVFLRRNKIDGRYVDPEHYLDVQFRLLREDFVRPLREGINKLLERMGAANLGRFQDIRVYHKVRILYPVFTSKGLTHKLSFDVSRMRGVRWENSKRLIYGSLLCLSKDKFDTFLLATVENRDMKELKEGRIEVRFASLLGDTRDLSKSEYDVVETTAYFEAYRHVLQGLKEVEPERLPFKRYIVECQNAVNPPAYLTNRFREEVTYDLTPIMKGETATTTNKRLLSFYEQMSGLSLSGNNEGGKAVRILHKNSWPSAEDLGLDSSQLKAVQLALTNEFAIIQGPPGTGKTYIGLKVVKVLLHNKSMWNRGTEVLDDDDDLLGRRLARHREPPARPILVVCYTNHALDQFLEGILEFHPEGIVRVGGRSQSEVMKECSLRELKYKMHKSKSGPKEISRGFYEIHQKLDTISQHMKSATENLQKCMENVIHEKALHDEGHMTDEQYESMIRPLEDPYTGRTTVTSAIVYWLGLLANNVETNNNFVQPAAVFPFNSTLKFCNALNQAHKAVFRNVHQAVGVDGRRGGSYELQGARDSYVIIPNIDGYVLDMRCSMTILLYVFPMSPAGGPIVCYHRDGFVGVEVSQDGLQNGKGVLSASFRRRGDGACLPPVRKAVLKLNEWNYIGASYDNGSGLVRLWHNGRMVAMQNIGPGLELASDLPVFLGSLNRPNHNSFFEGRVCCLQFFPHALGKEQVMAIADIREEDLQDEEEEGEAEDTPEKQTEEEKDKDILYEADAMEGLRVLDDDNVIRFGGKQGRGRILQLANPFPQENSGNQALWQVQNPKKQKDRIKRTIKRELSASDKMEPEQARRVMDVWKLSSTDKWRLYRFWIEQMCSDYRNTVESYQQEFEEGAERLREVKSMEDLHILKTATVIGMTTTGAAKYRKLIQTIKPRITIVEEAAEVLEAHIVTSLSPGCQHLILIGDHQQLRPNPNVFKLAKDYKLDMSLFERMVTNGMKFEKLHAQHRMRPEIARMMSHIYDNLENHESVLNFESIKSVSTNIFFVEHSELEEFIEEGRSRSNIHEAKYLAALCRYFILQGYKRTQITILTMYTGQLIQLKKEMPRDFFNGVRICAVDNYQGEENDIILLSLVRSNEQENIGFLRISNRVCVALSRAKKGFYCIGNIEMMCRKEKLWNDIITDMRTHGKVGPYLTLTCQNHPKNSIKASKAEDFRGAPEGGCMEPCNTRLDCGHVCEMVCHPADSDHVEYKCRQKCTKTLCNSGHMCKSLCYQECGECRTPVPKVIPSCNHVQQVPCYLDPKLFKCKDACLKILRCSHQCANKCSEECTEKCMQKVLKKWDCGHESEVECHVVPQKHDCKAPCGEQLKCEHDCKGNCSDCLRGRVHQPCKAKCDRTLFCGHSCKEACTKNCPPCGQPCENKCVHSKCPKKCGEPCPPCTMPCAWKCEHYKCTRLCGRPCNRPRCEHPCKKILKCKHPCIGMCGEPCPKKCRVCDKDDVTEIIFGDEDEPDARFVELQPCDHVIEVNALDTWMDEVAMDTTTSIQLKRCPRCNAPIRTNLRYGNIVKAILADFEIVKRHLVVPDYKLQQEARRLNGLLSNELLEQLPDDAKTLSQNVGRKNLTSEQLNMYENQINFMNFLSKMKAKIYKDISSEEEQDTRIALTLRRARLVLEASLQKEVASLRSTVMKLRARFSDQEKDEINDEIWRVYLVICYRILVQQIKWKSLKIGATNEVLLNYVRVAITSGRRIDETKRKRYMDRLDRVRTACHLTVHYQEVTRDEKDMIVKAIGLAQGKWYKCPNGHVYCIGECGGATEEGKCPECKATIGGTRHALRSDNSLASDMDGARHSAWSNFTNEMGNFNFDD